MSNPPENLGDWSEFRTYPTASEAEFDAAYLCSEGVEARVTLHTILPGQPGHAIIWIDRSLHERAEWLLKLPPVSESELEFLATGKLPSSKDTE